MPPQNPNPYQTPPQGPQVYGPQQYSPFPSQPGVPEQKPKGNKKLLIIVVVLVLLLIGVLVTVLVLTRGKKSGLVTHEITRTYDSPVGLLPGMQSADVTHGKFKMTASYVTGRDFVRENEFFVDGDKLEFHMIPDNAKANDLLKNLYDRSKPKKPFDATKHGADAWLTYSFSDLFGYHYLYNEAGGELSGFVPQVIAAKQAKKPSPIYKLTSGCDAALAEVQKKTDTDMTTTGMQFEYSADGIGRTKAVVSFSTMQAIDRTVISFFDNCYDLDHKAAAKIKTFVENKREDVTKSPAFTYGQENGAQFLEISAPPDDTPFGGRIRFELTEFSAEPMARTQELRGNGSHVERRNQFGLAYSACRVDPIVTRASGAGYRFMREDPNYAYPVPADTGYYCEAASIPIEWPVAEDLVVKSTVGGNFALSPQSITDVLSYHDLVYKIEQYRVSNKRYPGPTEFRDLATNGSGDLVAAARVALEKKSLVYTATPERCIGNCADFSLTISPAPNVQIRRGGYEPTN